MSHTPTASPAKIIKVARAEVGYQEGRSNGHWNNHQKFSPAVPSLEWSQNQAWCATFLSWCAQKADLKALYPVTASTDLGARWFKDRKSWSEYPAIGALGYLGDSRNDMYHVFLVVDFDDAYVYTIEGNTNTNGSAEGDGVYARKRLRRSSSIRGYGYPAFAEGIVSADPAWASKAPRVNAPKPPSAPVAQDASQAAINRRAIESLTRAEADLQALMTPAQRTAAAKAADQTNKARKWTVTTNQDSVNKRVIESLTRVEACLQVVMTPAQRAAASKAADATNKNRKW